MPVSISKQIAEAFYALETISVTSGSNAKLAILKENSSNTVLKTLFKVTYDMFTQYYLVKLPEYAPKGSITDAEGLTIRYANFLQLLTKLSQRDITGNAARQAVKDVFDTLSDTEAKWYEKVIGRDFKIGIADKSINKVFPGLIQTYEIALANSLAHDLNFDSPKTLKALPDRIVCQYKLDGFRIAASCYDDGTISLTSSGGHPVEGYVQLEKELRALPKGYVYDGEMMSPKFMEWLRENEKSDEVVEANREFFSEAASHAFSHETDKKGVFHIFDAVSIEIWNTRGVSNPYISRLDFINSLKPSPSIEIVPTSRIFHKGNAEDLQAIKEMFWKFVAIGWEGLMVKDLDSPYIFDRSNAILKMKVMDTLDLEVTAVNEGAYSTKYAGTLGSVTVDYKGYPVNVGSGWKDAQRDFYWNNPNEILGKKIEVAYQAESKDKNGNLSLSFPIFKKVRTDK